MNNEEFYNSFRFVKIRHSRPVTGGNMESGCVTNFFGRLQYGSARLVTQNITVNLNAGETVFIPKECRYESFWYPDGDGRLEWDSIGFDYFPQVEKGKYLLQKVNLNEQATRLLDSITDSYKVTPHTIGRLYELVGLVLPEMKRQLKSVDLVTEKAIKFMRESPVCSISEVARGCRVSESRLYAVFRESLNVTPNEMRQKIFCEKAEQLLTSTDLSVEEISSRLSFSSSSYFRKILKKHLGKTPSEIRKTISYFNV
ncbi:MAG: helix-turn-helix transcriptional regulator [Clostridia bacterium]|nr:helix-turn-helix transcriptional regulator [Clostridia bacterium]